MADEKEIKSLSDAEAKKKAKSIADKYSVSEVYKNSRDEFFTSKCNALNSEKDKSLVKTYTFKQ